MRNNFLYSACEIAMISAWNRICNLPPSRNTCGCLCAFRRTVPHRDGGAIIKRGTMNKKLHGHAWPKPSRTYRSWSNMIARCGNPNATGYDYYGGRGIRVCSEWRNDFCKFLLDMGERPSGKTLGRIDNDGPYCVYNCEWQTDKQQAANKRNVRMVKFKGQSRNLADWAKALGIPNLATRLYKGWTMERALATPRIKKGTVMPSHTRFLTHHGITLSLGGWANKLGMNRQTIAFRLRSGKSVSQALTPL